MSFFPDQQLSPYAFEVLVLSNDRSFTFQLERKAGKFNMNLHTWKEEGKPPREVLEGFDAVLIDCECVSDNLKEILVEQHKVPKTIVFGESQIEDIELGLSVHFKIEPARKILAALLESAGARKMVSTHLYKTQMKPGGHFHAG